MLEQRIEIAANTYPTRREGSLKCRTVDSDGLLGNVSDSMIEMILHSARQLHDFERSKKCVQATKNIKAV